MKRITIKEIAKATGYSANTVSRALSDRGEISRETADIIKETAKQMGYVPNLFAKGLAGGSTGLIGLIMGETHNPFHWSVVEMIQQELLRRNMNLVLSASGEMAGGFKESVNYLMSSQVDGVLAFYPDGADDSIKFLLDHQMPLVIMATKVEGLPASYVDIDSYMGGAMAAAHLAGHGRRNMCYVSREMVMYPSASRLAGFRDKLKELGLSPDVSILRAEASLQGGFTAAAETDFAAMGIDGIFAHNDLIAMGVISNLASRGIRVPEDISVVGFDDVDFATFFTPPLTTVRIPSKELTLTAIDLLMRQIACKQQNGYVPFESRLLRTDFIVRKST